MHDSQCDFTAPLLTGVEVRRSEERNNTLKLTATLRYTGGGTITHFVISFHVTEMSLWIPLKTNFTAVAINNSQLTWSTEVTDERFHNTAIELQVMVVNGDSYVSNVINISELIGEHYNWKRVSNSMVQCRHFHKQQSSEGDDLYPFYS